MRKCNPAGVALVKKFEGLRLKAYRDSVGVVTIGYGHTGGAKEGQVITQHQAEVILDLDLENAAAGVERLVEVPLTDNQFSALCSFVFNLGAGSLGRSELLKLINRGKFDEAAKQLRNWRFAGGKELAGLVARRKAERELFETPDAGFGAP